MLEGLSILESVTRAASDAWKAFGSSEGLTFLLAGVLVGFALAMALGAIGSRRAVSRPTGNPERETSLGSASLSRGISA